MISEKPIINGTLSIEGERKFYAEIEKLILDVISKEHSFNLEKLFKGDILRLITQLEILKVENYSELSCLNSKILYGIKIGLISRLTKISEDFKKKDNNTFIKLIY